MTRASVAQEAGVVLELGVLRGRRSCVGRGSADLAARGCGRVGADGQVACIGVGSEIRPDVAARHRLVLAGLGCWRRNGRWVAAVLDLAAFYVQHPGGTLRPGQLAAVVESGRPGAPAPSRSALHGCTPAPRPPPLGRPAGEAVRLTSCTYLGVLPAEWRLGGQGDQASNEVDRAGHGRHPHFLLPRRLGR